MSTSSKPLRLSQAWSFVHRWTEPHLEQRKAAVVKAVSANASGLTPCIVGTSAPVVGHSIITMAMVIECARAARDPGLLRF